MYAPTPLLGRIAFDDNPTTAMVRVVLSISAMVIQLQDPAEFFNLFGREMAVASRRQVQFEKADLHPPQFFNQQAEVLEHFADLVLAAFGDLHFIPGIGAGLDPLQFGGRGLAAVQGDALAKLSLLLLAQMAVGFHQVGFDDVACGRGDAVCEFAVVGQQQQAFAVIIQPPDRINPLLDAAQQVHDGLAALRIADRGHHALGFVQGDVNVALRFFKKTAVDFDMVAIEVRLGAELRDRPAVDGDAAFGDHLLGFPPAGDAGLRQDFLEALLSHRVSGCVSPPPQSGDSSFSVEDSASGRGSACAGAGSGSATSILASSSNSLSVGSSLKSFSPNCTRNSLVVL